MRSSRFVVLALAAVALAGCMQSGGSGIFARNAPPLTQNDIALPAMLRPAPDEWFEVYPVSTRVNSPDNNDAELVQRVEDSTLL